jgi:signal transduction histidine kinase
LKAGKLKEHKHRFKALILVPLGIVLLMLLLTSTVTTYRFQRLHIDENIQTNLDELKQITISHFAENSRTLSSMIDLIKEDENLQKAWLARDREALLRHALPIFNNPFHNLQITHFYFIGFDKVCFLRVHKPEYYGDTIDRFTLNHAELVTTKASGIELGPLGTITLRVVHPWWIGDELAGFIEIGVEIERLVSKLKSILDSELIITIEKSYLDRAKWEEGLKMMGRTGQWDQFPGFVMVNQTLQAFLPQLNRHIQFHAAQHEDHIFRLTTNNRQYSIGFVPLIDAGSRDIGDIIVLKDITADENALGRLLLIMMTASAFIGALLLGFFYLFVGRIEKRLVKTHNDLKDEIAERKEAEKALQQSRDELEIRVQERTVDLKKAMSNCKLELDERVRAEEEIRRLSQQLFSVIEEERKRLARDLHDEFGQALTTLHLNVEALQNSLPEELKDQKAQCDQIIRVTEQQCDNIRIIASKLRPDMLDHLGFIPTLEWYVEDFGKRNGGLRIDFEAVGIKKRPDAEVEITLYRILQESLNNIIKHAKAKKIDVLLTYSHPKFIFTIKDDGVGFEQMEASPQKLDGKQGIGLIGMRERVAGVGGAIDIRSGRGKGTVIRVEVLAKPGKTEA